MVVVIYFPVTRSPTDVVPLVAVRGLVPKLRRGDRPAVGTSWRARRVQAGCRFDYDCWNSS